jgi:hypothetical protein
MALFSLKLKNSLVVTSVGDFVGFSFMGAVLKGSTLDNFFS